MYSIRSDRFHPTSTRTDLCSKRIYTAIHCLMGEVFNTFLPMTRLSRLNTGHSTYICSGIRYGAIFARNYGWVVPYSRRSKSWDSKSVGSSHLNARSTSSFVFSCEILFSEFLSILKTSQVQAEMFEDMTRILIQNCQSTGKLRSSTLICHRCDHNKSSENAVHLHID